MTQQKLEIGKPIYTDELISTLSNLNNDGLVRCATANGNDIFEAHVRPNTVPENLRHAGKFTDYKPEQGAIRPTRVNEWSVTLVEQAGAAGGRG